MFEHLSYRSAARVLRREFGHVPYLPVNHDPAVLRLAVLLHLVGCHELFFRHDRGDCVRNCSRGEHNSLFPHGTRKQTRATTPCFVACCIHVVSGLWGVDGRLRAHCMFCPKQAWQLEDCGCGERNGVAIAGIRPRGSGRATFPAWACPWTCRPSRSRILSCVLTRALEWA